MATAKGTLKQRSQDSYTIIAPRGRDPETGKYRQVWQTVKRTPGETDAQLKSRAERELRKLLTKVDEGETIPAGRETVSTYIAEWLASKVKLSRRTAQGYASMMKLHVLPVIGTKALRNLQPADVERIYSRMKDKGLSGNMRLHVHRALSQALKAAVRKGKVARNVCDLLEEDGTPSKQDETPGKERFNIEPPSPEEADKLIKASEGTRIGVLVKLLAYTGMRIGEALGLRWRNIDFNRQSIAVTRARKLRIANVEPYGELKTTRSRRSVAIAPELLNALKEHRSAQMALNLELGLVPSEDFVFQVLVKGKIVGMGHDHVFPVWDKVRNSAGVPKARIHDLRHFAAATMLQAGVPLSEVSKMLGHSLSSTTLDIYDHAIQGGGKAAAAEIEKALAGK